MSDERFPGDVVTRFTPVSFALAFVHAMRKRSDLSQIPSVRTSVALPRFLTARYFRTGTLTAKDYVEAAVYLTPLEDQGAAFEIARELMFPKDASSASAPKAEKETIVGAPVVVSQTNAPANDDGPSIFQDLANMNLDLGSMDLASLDSLLDQKVSEATELKSLDLLTELSTSDNPEQKSLAALAVGFGGAGEIEAEGVRDEPALRKMLLERLFAQLGELGPETAVQAAKAGFLEDVIDDVTVPWERAAMLAAANDDGLDTVLDDVMQTGDAKEIGKTLRYLREAAPEQKVEPFRVRALSSARHLSEWAEIVDGLGDFVEPPEDLVADSARENLPRTLAAATALERAFSAGGIEDNDDVDIVDFDDANEKEPPPPRRDLRMSAFDHWAAALSETPDLDFLLEVFVPGERWEQLAKHAFLTLLDEVERTKTLPGDQRAEYIRGVLPLGVRLRGTKSDIGRQLASKLATTVLVVIGERQRFLPLLDALVDAKLMPDDAQAVVAAGVALGIDEEEILARLSQPLEQLRFLIEGNLQDLKRHLDLVDKIDHIPDDLLEHLIAVVVRDKNLMGLATLLAISLGPTMLKAPADLVDQSLQFKGIGGGENLLLQWYLHRDTLPSAFKDRVRALARQALLDAALPWMHKGVGGAERGLVPQARTRPYRAGDELDNLDVEGTLEQLASSGKTLDQMGSEDFIVSDTSSGRAGFGVLIDISGSMDGKDLAVCAIAVVMLLGRLQPEEIALALFESNTHVVKRFTEHRDLDDVASDLLELRATGGTRVDMALRFIADEFESQSEQEKRVLFLLSDFCFFEDKKDLAPLLEKLAALDIAFLGAAHGHFDKNMASQFVDVVGGQVAKMPSMQKLPDVLLQALSWIAEGAR